MRTAAAIFVGFILLAHTSPVGADQWTAPAINATKDSPVAATRSSVPAEPETSDTAVLPPPTPHRVWLLELYSGQTQIVDGDSGALLSSVYAASLSNYAGGPRDGTIYVAESVWSKGNRGDRQDLLTVYDGTTLKLASEIKLPGRMYEAPTTHNFVLNAAGSRAYVYNMQPASSVVVVDLEKRKLLRPIDIPGCALVFAWGEDSFSSLCGNGALLTVTHSGSKPVTMRSEPFFDAQLDPLFEESPSDSVSGKSLFVTFSGVVHPVQLNDQPTFAPTWTLQQAAGLDAASLDEASLAWRPGGRLPMALHRANERLYVLMHPGEPGSHKEPGTELWVVDSKSARVVRRMKLKIPVNAMAVSQDAKPLLYLIDTKLTLSIRDANTLEELRKIDDVRGVVPYVPPMP